MKYNIDISIICTTFNHEKYIKKCLAGLVMQKTDYNFEVIVHDDASTDNTAKIIKEFELIYPKIIKPIYQKENQYSKGKFIINDIIMPKVNGKYIAICEGDDCWIDENKLQIQVEYLEKNKECMCIAHASKIKNYVKNIEKDYYPAFEEKDFSLQEIVHGGGGLFSTNSLVFRKEIGKDMPRCFYSNSFADYQIPMFSAIKGKVHYIPFVMSLYNFMLPNSWTSINYNNEEKNIVVIEEIIGLLNRVNIYYNNNFNLIFSNEILRQKVNLLFFEKKYKEILKNKEFLKYYRNLSFKDRIIIRIGSFSPSLLKIILKIRGKKIIVFSNKNKK